MNQLTVSLSRSQHRSVAVILFQFEYNTELISQVKKLQGKWSRTLGCWYLPESQFELKQVIGTFKGKAWVDASQLYGGKKPVTSQKEIDIEKKSIPEKIPEISLPPEIDKKLLARRYSENTRHTYLSMLKLFFNYFNGREVTALTKAEIQEFILHLKNTRKYSTSSQNQAVNAVKFYFEQVLGQQRETYWIERPRKENKLPKVISEEEVIRLLNTIDNVKHLAIVSLIYSSGLRRSELLNLKKGSINLDRKQVKIENGKGKKDRITMLSDITAELLKRYVLEYKPQYYMFEGSPGKQYSATSVGQIVKTAAKKAGIPMVVTPHVLRHSFATHLMDQGIETRYIQTLLGHESLNTTAIYAHVSTKNLNLIESPLDRISQRKSLNIKHLNPNDKKG